MTPASSRVDGKVWVKNSDRAQILRLGPATGKWETFGSFKDPATGKTITSYGIPADGGNHPLPPHFASANGGPPRPKAGGVEGVKGRDPNSGPAPRPLLGDRALE